MRILPTSKEWLVLVRRMVAFGAGFAVWRFCSHLEIYSEAQTGMIVPADLQVKREIVGWLWFPFSWLPEPSLIGDRWVILKRWLIGVPYGLVVGLVILWLFRTSRPKQLDRRAFMRITRHIRFFIGFAIVTFLDIGVWWFSNHHQISLFGMDYLSSAVMIALFLFLVLLISVLGMICSLVAWFVTGVVASRRTKTSPQKDLSHV